MRESVDRLAAASYVCELVEMATEREDPNVKIHGLLTAILEALERRNDSAVLLIWFEIQLLAAAGWTPKWEAATSVNKVLRSLASASLKGIERVHLTTEQIAAGQRVVWDLWDTELGHKPRTRQFLAGRIKN